MIRILIQRGLRASRGLAVAVLGAVLLVGCVEVPWFFGTTSPGNMHLYVLETQHFGCNWDSFTTPAGRDYAYYLINSGGVLLDLFVEFWVPTDNGSNPDGTPKPQVTSAPCQGCLQRGKLVVDMWSPGGFNIGAYGYNNPEAESYLETWMTTFGISQFRTWRWYANIHLGNNEWIEVRREGFPTRAMSIAASKRSVPVCFVRTTLQLDCAPFPSVGCFPPA